MEMDINEVNKHSLTAFNKWKPLWIANCEKNKPFIKTQLTDFLNIYKDETVVLFSYGSSFLKNIEEFKNSNLFGKVKIGCVDKAFRALVNNGIAPDFVICTDGSIERKWIDGIEDKYIKNCILVSNVYAAPHYIQRWADCDNLNKIAWYLNKDNINTHHYFGKIVDYYQVIPAASNVGNSLVVVASQIFGAKNVILYAFDYCWDFDGNYYGAEDHPKKEFLQNLRLIDKYTGKLVCVSSNMDFSSRWLERFIVYSYQNFGVIVVNKTGHGICESPFSLDVNKIAA